MTEELIKEARAWNQEHLRDYNYTSCTPFCPSEEHEHGLVGAERLIARLADALEAERGHIQSLAKWVDVAEEAPSIDIACEASAALEAATTETEWQYSYVEKWSDGSGIYERETFKTKGEALECLAENVASVSGFNSEQTEPGDQLVALVERRQVSLPGPWLPVEGENV